MTPTDEVYAAVNALRSGCDHRYPIAPPHSPGRPGNCWGCGEPPSDATVSKQLREPLAALLEAVAYQMEAHGAVEGTASKAVHPTTVLGVGAPCADWTAALATARALNGSRS